MTYLYLHGAHYRADGSADTFWTQRVEVREKPLRHHAAGLWFTATGYGSRIPTRLVVKFNGRWRRVYCRCYSNVGTLYIGRLAPTGERIFVRECE